VRQNLVSRPFAALAQAAKAAKETEKNIGFSQHLFRFDSTLRALLCGESFFWAAAEIPSIPFIPVNRVFGLPPFF
jgi:hypothetical protein